MAEQADRFTELRERMVREQLLARKIRDPRILQVFREIPRHRFVPLESLKEAYDDHPLPIGEGQTISQPFIVALMLQALQLHGHETVLEIGTGSGYETALLACLTTQVFSLEIHASLAEAAGRVLDELGIDNIELHVGDGSQGLPDQAPFDAIVVSAAAPAVPTPLLAQLAPGGRLVIPVGDRRDQTLERWIRSGAHWRVDRISPVAFVPLVGLHGWPTRK